MSFYLTEGDYFVRSDINKQIRDIIIHGREFAFYKMDIMQVQECTNKMLIKLLERSVFNFLRQIHWLVNIHRLRLNITSPRKSDLRLFICLGFMCTPRFV